GGGRGGGCRGGGSRSRGRRGRGGQPGRGGWPGRGSRSRRARGARGRRGRRARAATRARLTFHSSSPRLWIAAEVSALSDFSFHGIRPAGQRTCVPLCPRSPVFHSHVPFGRDLCTHH